MRAFEAVEIPGRLLGRPRDARGYPIPYTVRFDSEGKPDFRVIDTEKVGLVARLRLCALCGVALGRHLAFIGGPVSFRTRLFTDMPMHKECAHYAVQVCPWLAAPSMRYAAELPQMKGTVTVQHTSGMATERPDRFFIATTKGYRPVRLADGSVVMQAEEWEWSEWWRHGARVAGDDE